MMGAVVKKGTIYSTIHSSLGNACARYVIYSRNVQTFPYHLSDTVKGVRKKIN